jgi:hypothetical protein
MAEDLGVYDGEAQACDHEERKDLTTCVVCPRCDTFVMKTNPTAIYTELTQELIDVQDFDSANLFYIEALEGAYKQVCKILSK